MELSQGENKGQRGKEKKGERKKGKAGMNNRKNYKKGKRIEIIKALYATGSLPYRSLRLYEWNPVITQRVVHDMAKEGIVKIVRTESGKQINLGKWNDLKEDYMDYLPTAYLEYYDKELQNEVRKALNDRIRGDRLQKNGEVILIMHESGIGSFPDEKKEIRRRDVGITGKDKMYFTSKEIKGVLPFEIIVEKENEVTKKIRNSRMHGFMVSPGGMYAVYNIGMHLIEWERYGECNMERHLERVLGCKMDGYSQKKVGARPSIDCLLFATDVMMFAKVILNENTKNRTMTLLNIDYAYEDMYGLPLNHDGKRMLTIMGTDGWKERMEQRMLPDANEGSGRSYSVACDRYMNGTYILLFAIPNITRLKQFLKRAVLENDRDKFHIYCFTYQIPLITYLAQGYVTIQTYDLSAYYQIEVEDGYIERRNEDGKE